MEEYITEKELKTVLLDIQYKLEHGEDKACMDMLNQMVTDAKEGERFIDRTYLGNVQSKKRESRIAQIADLLDKMNAEQVENVYDYAMDEYAEPNHEVQALEAIIDISKRAKNLGKKVSKLEGEQTNSGE